MMASGAIQHTRRQAPRSATLGPEVLFGVAWRALVGKFTPGCAIRCGSNQPSKRACTLWRFGVWREVWRKIGLGSLCYARALLGEIGGAETSNAPKHIARPDDRLLLEHALH